MILLAGKGDLILPDADDGRDDAYAEMRAFQRPPLFDMGFEISDVTAALGGLSWAAGKTGRLQRLAHRAGVGAVARGIDIVLGDVADIGPAAEKMAEMAFLIAP